MESIVTDTTFAPTELVVLNGEKFAKPSRGGIKLLHLDQKVDERQLGRAVLAAAVLANERENVIRVGEVREWKALFGLRKGKRPDGLGTGPASAGWSSGSLEARVRPLVDQLVAKKSNFGFNLFYNLIGKETDNPWHHVIWLVENGLVQRGLLDVNKEKVLKVFTRTSLTLPQATRDLAATRSSDPVQQLIDDCQRNRPEVWKALIEDIDRAASAQTTRQDSDGPSDL